MYDLIGVLREAVIALAKLRQKMTQNTSINQQQIQSLKVLCMSSEELHCYVEDIASKNCVADLDALHDSQKKRVESTTRELTQAWYGSKNTDDESTPFEKYGRRDISLQSHLRQQINETNYSRQEKIVLEELINRLDSQGFLHMDDPFVKKLYEMNPEKTENLVVNLQTFEPAGVGARSISERLCLQLQRKTPRFLLAEKMVTYHMDLVLKQDIAGICKKTGAKKQEIKKAFSEIKALNPYPIQEFQKDYAGYIIPDIIIHLGDNRFEVELNTYSIPNLTVDNSYSALYATADFAVKEYLNGQYRQISLLQKCIEQRKQTLHSLAEHLLQQQYLFFLNGEKYLRPLRQKELADIMGVHESTVSRCIKNKYLQCQWGTFPLKFFFSARHQSDCRECNTQFIIRQLIKEEDKDNPLSDTDISDILNVNGIKISRRTVSKYRIEMGFLNAKKRKNQLS